MSWDFLASRMKILEGGPLLSPFGLDILPTFLGDFRLVATDPKRASIRSPSTLKESPSIRPKSEFPLVTVLTVKHLQYAAVEENLKLVVEMARKVELMTLVLPQV